MDELLDELRSTRIRLGPSALHGVGVFAIADIAAGDRDLFAPPSPWRSVLMSDVERLPVHVQELVMTYCLKHDGVAYVPPHGFRLIDPVIYLNDSKDPNLKQVDGGNYFEALRDIRAGEELTVDYDTLEVESAHSTE